MATNELDRDYEAAIGGEWQKAPEAPKLSKKDREELLAEFAKILRQENEDRGRDRPTRTDGPDVFV